jgi:electron transport complex protein RnfG
MVLSLVLICVVCALALSWVYSLTKPQIEAGTRQRIEEGLKMVLPQGRSFKELEPDTVWQGYDASGKLIGIVFKVAPQGYGGPIETLVGLDTTGRIVGIKPSESLKETPGLGLKVREPWFTNQFKGLAPDEVYLSRDRDMGKIEAITAATISSRAITDGIRAGILRYSKYLISKSLSLAPEILALLPGAVRFEPKDSVWLGYDEAERLVGLLLSASDQGYGGPIEVWIGVDTLGELTRVWIDSNKLLETKGFGDRVASPDFLAEFSGRSQQEVSKVEVLTGATVSSRAAIKAISKGLERAIDYLKYEKE